MHVNPYYFYRRFTRDFDVTEKCDKEETFYIGGLEWKLKAKKDSFSVCLTVSLTISWFPREPFAKKPKRYSWDPELEVNMEYKITHADKKLKSIQEKFTLTSENKRSRNRTFTLYHNCKIEFFVVEIKKKTKERYVWDELRHVSYSDIILIVGNEKFFVSRECLSKSSEVLREMMKSVEEDGSIFIDYDCNPLLFQNYLELLYGGKALGKGHVLAVMELAEHFKDAEALKICEDTITEKKWSFKNSRKRDNKGVPQPQHPAIQY